MSIVIDALAASLESLPKTASLCVGLSGGLDSVVMLHGLIHCAPHLSVRALHVNHGLSPSAALWQQFCADFCQAHGVAFTAVEVDVKSALVNPNASIEAAARDLRYKAFASQLDAEEVLILAHHLDDQLETLLLRLMRGAGIDGLRGMPAERSVGVSRLLRPLLQVSRSALQNYAETNSLSWVEDDSNSNTKFDRNYCRHEVMPVLEKRWPNYRESLSKSLQLMDEAAVIIHEVAVQDIANASAAHAGVLKVSDLALLSKSRLRNALRVWLLQLQAPAMGWKPLNDVVAKLTKHRGAGQTLVTTGEFTLVAYKGELHALRVVSPPMRPKGTWQPTTKQSFSLPDNGRLELQGGGAIKNLTRLTELAVDYKHGGESCQLIGRPRKTLKQVFQEEGIPPWLRDRVPLLYSGDQLVYVPLVGPCQEFPVLGQKGAASASIVWHQPTLNWLEVGNSD